MLKKLDVDLERYKIEASKDFLFYWFYSKGPMGIIKKVVTFIPIKITGHYCFNLCLGDWNESQQMADDSIISNNQDTEKVLASVADIIFQFTDRNPNAVIIIEGNTESRIRLYQIKINKYLNEIMPHFELFGLSKNLELEHYSPGNKYLGFVGKRKVL